MQNQKGVVASLLKIADCQKVTMFNPKFDLDLKKGQMGEGLVRYVLCGAKIDASIEVKRDMLIARTLNLAIEYECRGKPSGIERTEADWYAFICTRGFEKDDTIIFIKTERLKELYAHYKKMGRIVPGGDDKASKMVLVPFKVILD